MPEKKMFATRIDKETLKRLKHYSVDAEKPIGDLVEDALKDLLRKYENKSE